MANCEPSLQEDGKLCCRSDFPSASKSSKAFSLPGLSGSAAVGDVPAEINRQKSISAVGQMLPTMSMHAQY